MEVASTSFACRHTSGRFRLKAVLIALLLVAMAVGCSPTVQIAPLSWRIGYDDANHKITVTNAAQQTAGLAFDQDWRLTKIDSKDAGAEFSYDQAGQLSNVKFGADAISYGYDAFGRLTEATYNSLEKKIEFGYDPYGRVRATKVTGPSGSKFEVFYEYDLAGKLRAVEDYQGRIEYSYDPANGRVTRTLPNGVRSTFVFSPLDELVSVRHETSSGSLIALYEYERDADGYVTSVREETSEGSEATTYVWDERGYLTGIHRPDGTEESYQYDSMGNRVSRTDGSGTISYEYDGYGRLTKAGNDRYEYDRAGRLISATENGKRTRFRWNSLDRLTKIILPDNRKIIYTYDPFGNLIRRDDGENVVDILPNPLTSTGLAMAEFDADGNMKREYIYADELTASEDPGAGRRYLLEDGFSSIRTIVDENGNVVGERDYSPFGDVISPSTDFDCSYRTSGEFIESAYPIRLLGGRPYNARLARFMAPDFSQALMERPDSFNMYAHSCSSPTVFAAPRCNQTHTSPSDFRGIYPNPNPQPKDSIWRAPSRTYKSVVEGYIRRWVAEHGKDKEGKKRPIVMMMRGMKHRLEEGEDYADGNFDGYRMLVLPTYREKVPGVPRGVEDFLSTLFERANPMRALDLPTLWKMAEDEGCPVEAYVAESGANNDLAKNVDAIIEAKNNGQQIPVIIVTSGAIGEENVKKLRDAGITVVIVTDPNDIVGMAETPGQELYDENTMPPALRVLVDAMFLGREPDPVTKNFIGNLYKLAAWISGEKNLKHHADYGDGKMVTELNVALDMYAPNSRKPKEERRGGPNLILERNRDEGLDLGDDERKYFFFPPPPPPPPPGGGGGGWGGGGPGGGDGGDDDWPPPPPPQGAGARWIPPPEEPLPPPPPEENQHRDDDWPPPPEGGGARVPIPPPVVLPDPFVDIRRDYGGVELKASMQFMGDLGRVTGLVYDESSGQMVLVGDRDTSLPPIDIGYFLLAERLISEGHTEIAFSLDPADRLNPRGEKLKCNWFPETLAGTPPGDLMFEADWVLKQYGSGIKVLDDWSWEERTSGVAGFRSMFDLGFENWSGSGRETWNRFWIEIGDIRMKESGNSLVIDDVEIRVLTEQEYETAHGLERMVGIADPNAKEFATFFQEHYDEIAQEEPVLAQLKEWGKVFGLVKWIHQHNIPVNFDIDPKWLGAEWSGSQEYWDTVPNYEVVKGESGEYYVNLEAADETAIWMLGGDRVKAEPVAVADDGSALELDESVSEKIAEVPSQAAVPVIVANIPYEAVVLPVTDSGRKTWESEATELAGGTVERNGLTYHVNDAREVEYAETAFGTRVDFGKDASGDLNEFRVSAPDGWKSVTTVQPGGTEMQITSPTGENIQCTWDQSGLMDQLKVNDIAFADCNFDAVNRTVTVDYDTCRETTVYDELGRPVRWSVEPTSGGGCGTTGTMWITYDENGQVSEMTTDTGERIDFAYENGVPTEVRSANTEVAYTWGPDGRVAGLRASGVNLDCSYSGDSIESVSIGAGSQNALMSFTDRILSRYTNFRGGTWTYGRDEAGVLTKVTDPSGAEANYEYDPDGRLTGVGLPSGARISYEYSPMSPQITAEGDENRPAFLRLVGISVQPRR